MTGAVDVAMTDGIAHRRSLAATGGTLIGPDYHFDLVRPGIGLYGGLPFADATPVEEGMIRLPDVPGVGFEAKSDLIDRIRSLFGP